MTHITVFFGVIGSGKTYNADAFLKETPNSIKVDFKDPLIRMSYDLTKSKLSYDDFKLSVVGVEDVEKSKELLKTYPDLMTGRLVLQRLGTEIFRKINPDYWAITFENTVIDLMHSQPEIVNCDMRFPNELKAILHLDIPTTFIFCDYKSPLYNADNPHESEHMVQAFKKRYFPNGNLDSIEIDSSIMKEFLNEYSAK